MKKFFLLSMTVLICGTTTLADELVQEQPAGTHKVYYGYSKSTYPMYVPITEATDGLQREVVFADNGTDVWFKDPLTHATPGTWIKGTLKDSVITVNTPQLIDRTEKDGKVSDWYVQRLKKVTIPTESGSTTTDWVPDSTETAITYIYKDSRIKQVSEEDIILGMTCEGKYMFYGETDALYMEMTDAASKFPEGSKPQKWSFFYNNGAYANQTEVVIDGNDFYLRGFWPEHPVACLKGTITDDKIVFPSGQLLGRLTGEDTSPRYVYFTSARKNPDAFGNNAVISTFQDMTFSYDRENQVVSPLFDDTLIPVVRNGKLTDIAEDKPHLILRGMKMQVIDHIAELPDITIQKGGAFVYEDTGWGQVEFTFRALDTEGNALDPTQMSYSLWLDDELLVFDKNDAKYPEAYEGIDEPCTVIPYMLDNGYGIKKSGSAAKRAVMFYILGFKEVGVQGFYHDDMSDRDLKTRITYINPETQEIRIQDDVSSVADFDATAELVETERYDINGIRVGAGYKGIVVDKCLYSDGTIKTIKRVVK